MTGRRGSDWQAAPVRRHPTRPRVADLEELLRRHWHAAERRRVWARLEALWRRESAT